MVGKIVLALSLMLCATLAAAQYTTNFESGVTDLTSYATSGTNAWFLLGGGGDCSSLSLAYDRNLWCIGQSPYQVWEFDVTSQTWAEQTAMGSGIHAIVVETANNIWSLQSASDCTNSHNGYGVFGWSGTAWVRTVGACLEEMQIGGDGTFIGVTTSGGVWTSSNGINWNSYGAPVLTYVALASYNSICGVGGGKVYLGGSTGLTLVSPQPPGTSIGCAVAQDDPVLLVWNSAGTVSLSISNGTAWSTVAGLAPSVIVATQKSQVAALDSTGHPYHWNVYGGYTSATITGIQSCPGGSCGAGVVHTGTVQVNFSNGGIGGAQGREAINPVNNMNVTSWDATPRCDYLMGSPNDPNCNSNYSSGVNCSAVNRNIYSAGGQMPSFHFKWSIGSGKVTQVSRLPGDTGEYTYQIVDNCSPQGNIVVGTNTPTTLMDWTRTDGQMGLETLCWSPDGFSPWTCFVPGSKWEPEQLFDRQTTWTGTYQHCTIND